MVMELGQIITGAGVAVVRDPAPQCQENTVVQHVGAVKVCSQCKGGRGLALRLQ